MTDTAPLTEEQLRDRINHAMRAAVSLPTLPPVTEHGKHRYELGCALCHGDVEILTNAVLAVVQPELDRLRARQERDRAELTRRRTEDLNLRGTLAPADGPRRVPMALGETLVPAVEWLLAEVARLRELLDQHTADIADKALENAALRAELTTLWRRLDAAHCRLHHIQARVEQISSLDDPCAIGLDLIRWLDGPIHPDHLAAWRAAANGETAAPSA